MTRAYWLKTHLLLATLLLLLAGCQMPYLHETSPVTPTPYRPSQEEMIKDKLKRVDGPPEKQSFVMLGIYSPEDQSWILTNLSPYKELVTAHPELTLKQHLDLFSYSSFVQVKQTFDLLEQEAAWRKAHIESRPAEIQDIIAARKIRIGMTTDDVRASWGRPQRKSSTVTTHLDSETWSYNRVTVYFEKGQVTGWHTTE